MMSPTKTVLLRQLYFSGIESLPAVMVSGFLIGFIIVFQTITITKVQLSSTIGKILVWLIFKEIGPFFTGLIVLIRSGSAISSELATMKLGKEIDYLEAMGIKPEEYLISPRIYAIIFSTIILSLYFQFSALLAGFLVAFINSTSFSDYTSAIFSQFAFKDIAVSLIKSAVFGFCISLICIWHGLSVNKSPTQIPQRTTKALSYSLFTLFAIDALINFAISLLE